MNNNISLRYNTKTKKNTSGTNMLLTVIASVYLGAEYTAYLFGYAICTVINAFKNKRVNLCVAIIKKYAPVCAVCVCSVFLFGVVGGMEAGTINPVTGLVICGIMLLTALWALNKRK